MGQWDVHDFLGKNGGKWFTTRQLSEQLGVSLGSVASCAKRLRRAGLIESKTVKWASKIMRSTKEIFAYRSKEG